MNTASHGTGGGASGAAASVQQRAGAEKTAMRTAARPATGVSEENLQANY